MTKFHGIKTLSEMYANKYGTTLKVAEMRIKEMKEILEEGISDPNYEGIQLVDSLTFKRVIRKGKVGRNPRTKIECVIPDRVGVKTELGRGFSEKLSTFI